MNTNETIPEIVADMRTKYPPEPNCIHTVTGQYVHDEMTWLADRIEAAAARMEQHPKAKNYGNMAKIRHAAELMVKAMKKTDLCDYREFNEKQCKACACKRLCKAVKGLEDALSLPARQCDIGTAKEQAERMANFCKQQYTKSMPGLPICHKCKYHDNCTECECTFAWMQSPFKKSGVAK